VARAYISIGSNISPERNILEALRLLAAEGLDSVSTVYWTEAVGRPGQPRFLNCVAGLATGRPPAELKAALKRLEGSLGRVRTGDKYAPRAIDLDLIAYDDVKVARDGFVLPDPDIEARPFIAIPLLELDPYVLTPSGRSIEEVARGLNSEGMEEAAAFTDSLRRELFEKEA